jgi:hypothetical protein
MASQAPASPPATGANRNDLIPPDEKFWVRYSPHHEFPLSNVTSIALHILVFGLLLLLVRQLGSKEAYKVPVEAVRLGLSNPGGGGKRSGTGEGPGGPAPVEATTGQDNPTETRPPEDNTTQRGDLPAVRQFVDSLNPDARRFYQSGTPPPNLNAFAGLNESARLKFQQGIAPRGRGGSGSGGGQGEGTGTGTGSGTGDGAVGKGTLTQRERRMLRWTMLFNTNTGPDYLRQLHGLGAILAIPVREGAEPDYRIVRNLTQRPAQLVAEDLSKIQRIYWVDNKPQAVADIMAALGLNLRPSHFVAFMPEELENKLFEMERRAAKGRPEDDINETKFRVKRMGDRYEPELELITFKK